MSFVISPLFLLLVVANVLGVGMLVPQGARLAKSKSIAGVSPRWVGLGFGINIGWLAYATLADLPGLLPVSAGALVLYGWMLISLGKISRTAVVEGLLTSALLLAALVLTGFVGGVAAVGIFGLGFLYTVQFAPAAWESFTSSDLSGIAPVTWIMGLVEAAIWTVYGRSTGDLGLVVGGTGASIMAIIVLVNLLRSQLRTDQQRLARRVGALVRHGR